MKKIDRKKLILLLDKFFKHPLTDRVTIILVVTSSVVAVASLFQENSLLNKLNLFFSAVFALELSLRFLNYGKKGRLGNKKAYFKEWWLDWTAIVPWDIFLGTIIPGSGPSAARLLRIPRIIRILRFRHVKRSRVFRIFVYRLKRLIEGSLLKQFMVLGIFSTIVIVIFTLLFNIMKTDFGHGDNFWFSLITMFSSDSLFEVAEQSTEIKVLILVLTSVGIVLFNGIIIAVIIGRLMEHLHELKKGHGEVCEKGHIILLGRNEFVSHLLDEIDMHCRIERKTKKVVVMRESAHNDDDFKLKSRPRVEVIPRTGGFWNSEALERVSLAESDGVIIFGGVSESYDDEKLNDSLVTKTLVSINTLMHKSSDPERKAPNLVLNYMDSARINYSKGYLKRDAEKCEKNRLYNNWNPVFFDTVYYTAKMFSCLCSNPHAYSIYNELLTAEGNEFHSTPSIFPENTAFGEILNCFPDGIPVGFLKTGEEFECRLLPDSNEKIPLSSEIIVLAANSYDASNCVENTFENIENTTSLSPKEKKGGIVIIGVNDKLPRITEEFSSQGREQVYVIDNQSEKEFFKWYEDRLFSLGIEKSKTIQPIFRECHFKNETEVKKAMPFRDISTVIILADALLLYEKSADQIDADTFSRILMIQHLLEKQKVRNDIHLVVEILTKDTETVVSRFEKCSHVVGPLFTARLLTTFLLYPYLEKVFSKLIKTGETDIICIPYKKLKKTVALPNKKNKVNFENLLTNRPARAIPLGWINNHTNKIVLNPPKNAAIPEKCEIIYISSHNSD